MTYAIVKISGKQYLVREGERLLVERLPYDEGKTFSPDVLLVGGNGAGKFGDELKGEQVTVRVAAHVLGEKLLIGKHRRRTGYRRRKGHRSRLSQIEIQSIGTKATRAASTKKTTAAAENKPAARKKTTPKKKEGDS